MAKAAAPAGGFKEGCLGMLGLVAFAAVWRATSFVAALGVAGGLFVLAVVLGVRASNRREREAAQRRAAEAERQRERDAVRYAGLVERFGETDADRIVDGEYWQGATFEMIYESLGQPEDTKESVYKAKTKTTYLYRQISAQRFELKVFFENGVCVGWED